MTDEQLRNLIIFGTLALSVIIVLILQYTLRKKQETQVMDWSVKLQQRRLAELKDYKEEILALLEEINQCAQMGGDMNVMTEECRKYTGERISGNGIIDALLSYKKACGQRNQIPVELAMSKLPNLPFSDTEYVGLFGNLLDNAMEAAAKTEKPWVKLESFTRGGQWLLKVTNSKPAMDKPLECAMATTKGSGHGLGTKIISKIVKRHKGAVEYKDLGETFEAMVVFSAAEGSEEGA